MRKTSALFLLPTLALALFLRTYRISDLLGFYYDQGRDALVVWQLIHQAKPFLIGPTTGIEGIFLGPFYYYLIAPFYALGQGNPVVPAFALSLINVLAIALLFYIARLYFNRPTAYVAAFLVSFSYVLVISARWLSNPTPLPLFSLIAVLSQLKLAHTRRLYWWPILGLTVGLSLQLEAASAIFFLPALAINLFLSRRRLRLRPVTILAFLVPFVATLLPQVWFDFRHDHLISRAFYRFLVSEKSFTSLPADFLSIRLTFFYKSFTDLLFSHPVPALVFTLFLFPLALFGRSLLRRLAFRILLVWWLTPLVFLLFYHGNHGYIWGYYLTGIYPVFLLIVSALGVQVYRRHSFFRPALLLLLIIFTVQNFTNLKSDLFRTGYAFISLTASVSSVDWVYADAAGRPFNVDVYVPPVIPAAYDYLFLWRGNRFFGTLPDDSRQSLLYTLHEADFSHPRLLDAWLARQAGLGTIEDQVHFGSVTVERRTRFSPL